MNVPINCYHAGREVKIMSIEFVIYKDTAP